VPPRNEPPQESIHSLLSEMQSAITAQIQKVQTSVDSLSNRVDQLEDDISYTVEQVQLYKTSLASLNSSSSTESEGPCKQRRRRIPPDVSVSACLYNLLYTTSYIHI